ncbi:ABC transporter permease subunit [Luteolibacter algae]|uniref:ABC transporter permease subunit n=1 Tax=Luteolibacter algae TaxID=454151 RepID=A0ABW5D6W8_9BACT
MSKRTIGLVMFILGLLAVLGELRGIDFPTARWFFETSREVPLLRWKGESGTVLWFGWLSSAILIGIGLVTIVKSFFGGPPDPVSVRRIQRFKEIKRGYYSLIILYCLVGLAALDQVIVGKEALAVRYKGEWSFPAFTPKPFKGSDFGIEGERADAPVNYRKLKIDLKKEKHLTHGRVIMPLIPFGATNDTLKPRSKSLVKREGVYHESGSRKAYFGLAAQYYDLEDARFHLRYTLRDGLLSGPVDGWDTEGERVYSAEYYKGKKVKEKYTGEGAVEDFLAIPSGELRAVKYHPAPPIPEERNLLGTTSQGYDVLAYLYGGLQINFKAALIFLPIVYAIGITLGMLMGYLGGWFDLVMQRLIEIFSNMPFLFVVIIFSSMVPEQFKGLPVILSILIVFGWMGITYLMRTAAYRDKERDYISAARVLGAGTPRIIFRHLLPNTVAIIVTLVPFTISSLILSLTALDYLGFGLPPEYATWGRLLNDGLSNLSAPWLVSSTFFVLVGQLVLITFIGEAVREAFDPKKYSYYR